MSSRDANVIKRLYNERDGFAMGVSTINTQCSSRMNMTLWAYIDVWPSVH